MKEFRFVVTETLTAEAYIAADTEQEARAELKRRYEADEIIAIVGRLKTMSGRPVLVTRMDSEKFSKLVAAIPEARYFERARIAAVGEFPEPDARGEIAIVTGGTSDGAVAEEAAVETAAIEDRFDASTPDLGFPDPGATSSALILAAIADVLAEHG